MQTKLTKRIQKPKNTVKEDLTVAFLTLVYMILKVSRIQVTKENNSYIKYMLESVRYFIL